MKGRKTLLLFGSICLALVLVMLPLMSACAPEEEVEEVEEVEEEKEEEEVYHLVFQTYGVRGPNTPETDDKFCELAELMSDGRIQIEYHELGDICGSQEVFQAVRDGVLDMGKNPGVYYQGFMPCGYFSWGMIAAFKTMPESYYFHWKLQPRSWEEIYRDAIAEFDVHLICTGPAYNYGEMASTVPIRSLEDFKGLKIRSFGQCAKICEALGAQLVQVSMAEKYTALALGTIDAAMSGPASSFMDDKTYEVAKYYIEPKWLFTSENDFLCNVDTWNSLPRDIQEILASAARRSFVEGGCFTDHRDIIAKNFMREQGVEFCRLSDEDMTVIRELGMQFLRDHANESGCPWEREALDAFYEYEKFLGYLD